MAKYAPVYVGDRNDRRCFRRCVDGWPVWRLFSCGVPQPGGTDIISFLVKKWYPHVPIGRMIMVVDCIIIGVSVLVFGNLESALYGLISLYCCSMVIDSIIYGLDKGSMVMVVSEKNDEIAAQIMDELERGVTLLKGQGAYTGTDRDVLMCAVRKQQFARVRAIIYEKESECFCDCQ